MEKLIQALTKKGKLNLIKRVTTQRTKAAMSTGTKFRAVLQDLIAVTNKLEADIKSKRYS